MVVFPLKHFTRRIAMADQMVGAVPDEVFGTLADIMLKLKTGGLTAEELKLFAKRENPFVSGNFKYDRRKDGWTLLENQPCRIGGQITAVPFLKTGESLVKSNVMIARAVVLDANYGQGDAEWLLEHQDMISVKLRNLYLIFPATKWQVLGSNRLVPHLYWFSNRWCLDFRWLGDGFGGGDRLVRPRK